MAADFVPTWDIKALKNKYIEIWENTPDTFPELPTRYNNLQQKGKDARMGFLADEITQLVRSFSDKNGTKPDEWGSALKKLLYECGTDIIGFDAINMKLLLEGGFCEVTSDFIAEARDFDACFKMDEIFQALRNVWIMNCLQFLMGREVEETPSVFAYSMLYPYTDNYLDSYSVSADIKGSASERFEKRLAGEKLKACNEYERKLFSLVDLIEGQYSREQNPMVYVSLLGIHSAQQRSLLQQTGKLSGSYKDLIDISIEKGGTSVLADACLVKGSLTPEEASFAFGFGLLLQLLDDLQDAAMDRSNGHFTLFSNRNSAKSFESNTNKLINFTIRFMNGDNCFNSPDGVMIKNMILKSIEFMLLTALANNSRLYSREYLRKLEASSPLSFRYLKKLCRKIGREYGKLKIKLTVKPIEVSMARAFAAGTLLTGLL